MGTAAASPRDYVVHAASPTRKWTIPDRRDFGRTPLFKRGAGLSRRRNLIIVGHHQQPVSPPARTSQWLFGDWGRAG